MKALPQKLRGAILVQLLVLGPLSACSGPDSKPDEPALVEQQQRSDDELLFAAVLDVMAEEGIAVDIEDPARGLVLSHWTEVHRELRHRWVARVVRSNVGLVLTVDSTYERRQRDGAHVIWRTLTHP